MNRRPVHPESIRHADRAIRDAERAEIRRMLARERRAERRMQMTFAAVLWCILACSAGLFGAVAYAVARWVLR
jgi:hypothetical protein